jgi:hypothetical protein
MAMHVALGDQTCPVSCLHLSGSENDFEKEKNLDGKRKKKEGRG